MHIISINDNKVKRIFAFLLAAVSVVIMLNYNHPKQALAIAMLFVGAGMVKVNIKNAWLLNIFYLAVSIALSTYAYFFSRSLMLKAEYAFNLGTMKNVLNVMIVLMSIGAVLFLTGRWRVSILIGTLLAFVLATTNFYVFKFRDFEFTWRDLLAVGTAADVVGGYKPTFPLMLGRGWLLWLAAIMIIFMFSEYKFKHKLISRAVVAVILVFMGLFVVNASKDMGIRAWRNHGTLYRGYYLAFYLNARDTRIKKPENYSEESLEKIAEQYDLLSEDGSEAAAEDTTEITTGSENTAGAKETAAGNDKTEDKPTIIAIMNESFADLSLLGENFNTDVEMLPYYKSMKENTVKGHALVSTFGGGTANSEFEFLTGNSIAFLSTTSIVYQQYIKRPMFSLAQYLKQNGYYTMATHPNTGKNWSRERVYPLLGFDKMTFISDYPKDDLLANVVTDKGMYDYIIKQYENNDTGKPLFLFGVTMQNHGGYYRRHFENPVKLSGYKNEYNDVQEYLTVANMSDAAIKYLIEYFENVDDKVEIVLFGDHYPNLTVDFYNEVHGGEFETLDEQELLYEIPYFVWTNYDSEEEEDKLTGVNYLSNIVLEKAGIELAPYNKFLANMQEQISAVNQFGFYSNEDQCFKKQGTGNETEETFLKQYWTLEYNSLFDKNSDKSLFPIE